MPEPPDTYPDTDPGTDPGTDRPTPSARPTPAPPGALRHPLTPALAAMWVVALVTAFAWGRTGIALWAVPLPLLVVAGAHWLAVERFRIWRIHHERRLRDAERVMGAAGPNGAGEPDSGQRRSRISPLDLEVERLASSAMQLAQRIEEAALEVENLRGILDGVDDPVLAVGPASDVLLMNASASALLGRRSALAGQRTLLEDLLPQAEMRALHARAARGEAAQATLRLSLPEAGLRVYNAVASPVRLGGREGRDGPGVVVCLHDTTELSHAVQLKTDFVANASHEFRTPLSAIRGAAETLAEIDDDPDVIRRMTEMIGANVQRLEALTTDLLDMSRVESPDSPVDYELIEVATLMDELTELFAGVAAERGVGLRTELAPDAPVVRTSRLLIEATLKNLIDNAIKFAEPKTDVIVRTVALAPDAAPSDAARAGWPGCRFEVVDRGIGIPMDQQTRIFERFHQVDTSRAGAPRRRGTGLGLSIVKHAVRKLGGRVGVDSVWKRGSTFWFELPGCVPVPEPQAEPGPRADADSDGGAH